MAKWGPLRARLESKESLTLSWVELDVLVGGLPPSAYNYTAFWGGDRSAWAGFRTTNVRVGQSVTFVRFDSTASGLATASSERPASIATYSVMTHADVVLVSCVKEKKDRPAPAKDLYVSALFRKERAYAEAAGVPWFILSAKHGLVEPNEMLAPYELQLSQTSMDYRQAWGVRVVKRLVETFGPLGTKVIEVHAGAAYIDPMRELLMTLGADVVEPLAGMQFGSRLAWYNAVGSRSVKHNLQRGSTSKIDALAYVAMLQDAEAAQTPAQFLATNGRGVRLSGLYGWWVDAGGAADLTNGVGHLVRPGLIYAGLAGATRERSGRQSANTLWHRISGMHLGGRHEFSTLRLTLGSALVGALGWNEIDESALTEWMHAHLRVIAIPVSEADTLGSVESSVLHELDPPFNLSKVAKSDLRMSLTALRRQYSRKQRRPR